MEKEPKTKKKKKNHSFVSAVIVTLILLIGLSLLLYPTVSNYINSLDYKKTIESYQRDLEKFDDSAQEEMLKAAKLYNKDLITRTRWITDLPKDQKKRYNSLLNPCDTGMMGYIEIESLNVYLPIYHGTDDSVLQAGVGHIEGSSLPVGGKGVHTFLSGHTGLPSAKLFSNIDQMKAGDTFALHILGKTLTYKVESTVVVLPEEVGNVQIEPEKDICTLMTCTPYGVNTHRLLVRGIRIKTPANNESEKPQEIQKIPAPIPPAVWLAVAAVVIVLLSVIISSVRSKKRKKRGYDGK